MLEKMRRRCQTVEHPFGTIKARRSKPLLDEDAATGCRRDGTSCAGLQSHARHEHHRYPTAHGGDEGIVADMRPSAREQPPKTADIRIRRAATSKKPPNSAK